MRKDYDIVGSYNNQRFTAIDAERSVNLFEYIDPNGKRQKILLPTSGLTDTALSFTPETLAFRAQFVFRDIMFCVVGSHVFTVRLVANALTVLQIGTITTFEGHVGIDANTYQVIFVDGVFGYIYDINANTFTKITDTSFPTVPIDVCFLDGFFVVANGGTNQFQLSSLNQGMVWGTSNDAFTTNNGALPNQLIVSSVANYATGVPVTLAIGGGGALPPNLTAAVTYYSIVIDTTHIKLATTYANAIAGTAIVIGGDATPTVTISLSGQLQLGTITSHPGNIVACRTLHRRLFLFSAYFTEIWENAGIGTNLPFRRNNSLLMEVGTPSIGSIAVGFDRMIFLSQTRDGQGSVMDVSGVQSVPVSGRALDFQLGTYAADGQISDANGFLIKENGLIFYRLNFTAANHTYVFGVSMSDAENLRWHEEEVLNGNRHPAQTHAYFNGINYVGSYNAPILYVVDSEVFTNNGEAIRRMRIAKPFAPEGYNRIRCDRFQVDFLQGSVQQILYTGENLTLLTESTEFVGSFDIETESGNSIALQQEFITESQPELKAFLSLSKDSGQSFGYLIPGAMGKVGERSFRTVWRKLGTVPRGQAFVPKIQFFNNAPCVVLGAAWDFEIMPE